MTGLVRDALLGDRRALARLISHVEDDPHGAHEALAELYPHTGIARVVGVTGSPGCGKSTLVARLAEEYRSRDMTVGIVAVDPTSPYSGGALLGDRVRMGRLVGDHGTFVRSMASRGHPGGIARATDDVVSVLDACGFQRILVETVGAGQGQIDISRVADTVVVIQVPRMGDDIQALKAGILEIADIVVVNKADLEGAERTAATLQVMLGMGRGARVDPGVRFWELQVIQTIATTGRGANDLVDAIELHSAYLDETGKQLDRKRSRIVLGLADILQDEMLAGLMRDLGHDAYEAMVDRILAREIDPHAAAGDLILAVGWRRPETERDQDAKRCS